MHNFGRLLYIGLSPQNTKNGGDVVHIRNETVLKKIFGSSFFSYDLVFTDSMVTRIFNKLFLYPRELSPLVIYRCLRYIRKLSPAWIFLSTSHYGLLAKKIKKICSTVIITYFHNIERDYARDYLTLKKPYTLLFYWLCRINEAKAVRYSDICVCINDRDKARMKELYNRECEAVIPVSMNDRLNKEKLAARYAALRTRIHSKQCLFVGSNFFGNTQGLSWFIKEILPFVDITLTIVGTGMSRSFSNGEKLSVFDYVEDLSDFYFNADFVILPVISGGGMKVKTAEAMMYGKAIIGTKEAFTGYELGGVDKIFQCETKDDFTRAISGIYSEEIYYFNDDIRKIFLEKYSTGKIENKFLDLFTNK